jgi:hypothetical protein
MLGWCISVCRQNDTCISPATDSTPLGAQIATWQTGLGGLDWLNALVKVGKAVDLGGNGYPCRYTATAEHLIPQIIDAPPGARLMWSAAPADVLTDKWEGKTVIDRAAAADCRFGEWLIVEAWDES